MLRDAIDNVGEKYFEHILLLFTDRIIKDGKQKKIQYCSMTIK